MQPSFLRKVSHVISSDYFMYGFLLLVNSATLNVEISANICSLRCVAVAYLLLFCWLSSRLVFLLLPLASVLIGGKL